MMPPPPNIVANPLITRRSSSNLQLILPDNLKTEVLDENSENSLMEDNSMSGLTSSTHNATTVAGSLGQLMNDNARDSSQNGLIRSAVTTNGSPVQDALLGVVDLIRNQHPLGIVSQQSTFRGLHEQSQVMEISFILIIHP
jgi:nuclear factor of activated T-cells 5